MKTKLVLGAEDFIALPQTFPSVIDEHLSLGLDLGIGSCGQALVHDRAEEATALRGLPEFPNRIQYLGVRAFDVPEVQEKTGPKLKNPERRRLRLARRTVRRRADRMWEVRRLLHQHGLLGADYPLDRKLWKYPPPKGERPDFDKWRNWHARMTGGPVGQAGPWVWRVEALDQKLDAEAFAAVLLHLAKHRGFKSNRKSMATEEDAGKVLTALRDNRNLMAAQGYRTIGEMFLKDPAFADRKRNRPGVYSAMIYRAAQEEEAKLIFRRQRELGNHLATPELEAAYLALFNKQLPLQNAIKLLANCPFEETEKRCSRYAPSFELSRALQKLNTLKLLFPDGRTVRLADHVNAAAGGYTEFIQRFATFAGTKAAPGRITWKDLRAIFHLDEAIQFADLPQPKITKKKDGTETVASQAATEGQDFLARSSANCAAKGSYLLRQAIGEALWTKLAAEAPEQLDQTAFALTFFEEIENSQTRPENWGILNQMRHEQLHPELIAAVRKDLESATPTLHQFAGSTSMSALACRKLIPLLAKGQVYSDACTAVYGDHRVEDFAFENITNPIVKSVVRESLKQVIHLMDETGKIPGRICVEVARDLGKSIEERMEIDRGIHKRTSEKSANRDRLAGVLGRMPTADELLRYELWAEQDSFCPYCGQAISGDLQEVATGHHLQVDHILPRSRSHDNSYDNKVLVHLACNQDKRNATPFEFSRIGGGQAQSDGWLDFVARVRTLRRLRPQKRRNLLNTTFAEDENTFAARHLQDTRYISRLVTHYLQKLYALAGEKKQHEQGAKRRVFVQPGQLTSIVRRGWNLEGLKKDEAGQRLGDKHHAVDALICALLSERHRQFITLLAQEEKGAAAEAFADFVATYQRMERQNDQHFIPRGLIPPWPSFRHDVEQALDLFNVSRREIKSGRGSLHDDTRYSIQQQGATYTTFTRKSLVALVADKEKKKNIAKYLAQIKGIDDPRNAAFKTALAQWVAAGCPVEESKLPRDRQGRIIRSVQLNMGYKSGRLTPHGFVSGGNLVRLDVFARTTPKGAKNYLLVPVYSYHLANPDPPNKAIVAAKEENEWDNILPTDQFCFSLWRNSYAKIQKKGSAKQDTQIVEGLYKGVNRNTGAIVFGLPNQNDLDVAASVKIGTLSFQKFEVDRLGRMFEIKKEKRTWRGRVVD